MIEMHTITPCKKSSKKRVHSNTSSHSFNLTRAVSRVDFLKKSDNDEFSECEIGSGDEYESSEDGDKSPEFESDHDEPMPPRAPPRALSQRCEPPQRGTFSNQQAVSDSDDDEPNQARAPSSPQRNSPSNQQAKKNGFSMEELRQRRNDARRSDVKLTPAQKKARVEEQKREDTRLRLEKEEAEQSIKDDLSNLQAEYERAREIYTNTKSSSDEETLNVARLKYNALKKYLDEALAKQNTKRKSKGKGSLNAGVKNATDKEEAKQAERQIKKDRNTRFNNLIDTCAKIVV
jgi:stalled ribosome alternative rescue factor ArfA